MAEDEEEQGLLEDDQLNEFPVGSTWIIDNRGRKKGARLFTGRLTFYCCFSTGIEILYLPDMTIVQVEKELPADTGVVAVIVLQCPKQRELENTSGSIQKRWLKIIEKSKSTVRIATKHSAPAQQPVASQAAHEDDDTDSVTEHQQHLKATFKPYENIDFLTQQLEQQDLREEESLQNQQQQSDTGRGGARRNPRRVTSTAGTGGSVFDSRSKMQKPVVSDETQPLAESSETSSGNVVPSLLSTNQNALTADALRRLSNESTKKADDAVSVYSEQSASSASSANSRFSSKKVSARQKSSQRRHGASRLTTNSAERDEKADDFDDNQSQASSHRSELYESMLDTMEEVARRSLENSRAKFEAAIRKEADEFAAPPEVIPPRMEFPSGYLQLDQLYQMLDIVKHFKMDLQHIFSALQDGKLRSITGDVYRAMLRKLETSATSERTGANANWIPGVATQFLALLNVLPNDYLTEIRVANGELTLHFDFQNEDNRFKLKLPPSTSIVIESASEDALAVCKENVLKVIKTDARKFYLNSEVKLTLSRTGIKSVRDGDIVQRGLFNLNATIRTERLEKRVDVDDKNRPYLWVLPSGKPASRNSHYCARSGSDWLIFQTVRSEYHIMLPDISVLFKK